MFRMEPARNFCRTSDYTRGRGYVLSIEDTARPIADVLDYLQRANFGMGVTLVRLRSAEPLTKARRAAWTERIAAHLAGSETAMNHEGSSVSLCRADVLAGGRYAREWYLAVIDNARGGDVAFDEFCAEHVQEPLSKFATDPASPIFDLNRRAAAARLDTADALLALCDPPVEREAAEHTPFFEMRVLDDGHTLEAKFLSHVCGDAERAVVCVSPAQGFWIVEFPRRGAGLGFPATLPRTGQFSAAEARAPPVPAAGLCAEGRRRAERMHVYPCAEEVLDAAVDVDWFGRARVTRQLQPVWVLVGGRTRHAHRKYEILNAF